MKVLLSVLGCDKYSSCVLSPRAEDSVRVCVRQRERCILLNSVSSCAALVQSMHHEIMLPEVFFCRGGGEKKLAVIGVCKRRK